ncbi:MAG: amylo-alpha-1,6-glucosidase [Candidatus Rokubacteria bacterium]|nr:amylo-alpha-1,6-glucosidase [Candidatus Rokubacteria bacterium]
MIDWGREVTGRLEVAERREWLCANGVGGFASGTVAGSLTRRYHGCLVAALQPPLGRTLMAAKVEEIVTYAGHRRELGTNRWASGAVAPEGYRDIERFRLEGTTPVWTFAVADALLDKRVWMEPGANTTYVRYALRRAMAPLELTLRALVNYRDHHATTRADGWTMQVTPVPDGLRVLAFDGARPLVMLARGADVQPAHSWYRGFDLPVERERGLGAADDHLHAGAFHALLPPGGSLTLVLSAEDLTRAPRGRGQGEGNGTRVTDGEAAWERRARHEADVLDRWEKAQGQLARSAPAFIRQLVLAADQFAVRRPRSGGEDGATVIAGYHWFGDWGRDTMIALPGLALSTGRPDLARQLLLTYAGFVDRGMLPNRFPDHGEAPEYNTADATLWYVEAIRAYHAATGDDASLAALYPVLEDIVRWHREGTRHRIAVDPADGLLRAGEPGVQLTWMDARVGDRVVTPRIGKPVEINALWYGALTALAGFAARLGRPADPWREMAARARAGFDRFWCAARGHCYDVIDGPGDDAALRPNQLLAVSLAASPLPADRQRQVVDVCARELLTSCGLRSLGPDHPDYHGRYAGGPAERDGAYHQGTVWAWWLGPFALAHARVHGHREVARSFLAPLAQHLADYGVGSIAEVFDGDAPFRPGGCIAQAWSVAEALRAWHLLGSTEGLDGPHGGQGCAGNAGA